MCKKIHKRWWLSLSLCILILSGCAATVPLTSQNLDRQGKSFNPPFSKGNLYIVRGSVFGSGILFQVNVDGKVRGAIAEETYLLVELTPGNHTVSVITEDSSDFTSLNINAGKNYFVEVKPTGNWRWPSSELTNISVTSISDPDGRNLVQKSERAQDMAIAK